MADTVSIEEICTILAGSDKEPFTKITITRFVKEGMPKAARGRYEPIPCLMWYVARLRSANQKRSVEGNEGELISMDQAQRRLILAKAETEELTLAERRGKLIPLHLHETTLLELVQITKQRILNIPARLAPKLEGCSTVEMKALLGATLKEALSEISRKEKNGGADNDGPVRKSKPRSKHARKPKRGKR